MIMGESAYIYMAFAAIALVPDGGNTWQMVRQLGCRRRLTRTLQASQQNDCRWLCGEIQVG